MPEKEEKIILEREYNIPLRKEWLKVPRYRRAKKAIKAIREFLARHMRADFEKIKVGRWLNEEMWKHGIKRPPHHIKIKATKDDEGIVKVELTKLPKEALEEAKREEKAKEEKKGKEKKEGEKEKAEEKKEEEKAEEKEKVEEEKEEKEKKEKEKILRKEITKIKHEVVKPKKAVKAPLMRKALEK